MEFRDIQENLENVFRKELLDHCTLTVFEKFLPGAQGKHVIRKIKKTSPFEFKFENIGWTISLGIHISITSVVEY